MHTGKHTSFGSFLYSLGKRNSKIHLTTKQPFEKDRIVLRFCILHTHQNINFFLFVSTVFKNFALLRLFVQSGNFFIEAAFSLIKSAGRINLTCLLHFFPQALSICTQCFASTFTDPFFLSLHFSVAKYQEANPTVFTIVTFPFLFAVMFGDWGHGICLLLATMYLILREKKLSSQVTSLTLVATFISY